MAWKSPGIYFKEVDKTDYTNPAASINTTVAIIGFAKQGPIGVPTEITNFNDYKSIFGTPIAGQYAGLAIRNVLSAGGTVLFTRIADESIASRTNVVVKNRSDGTDGILEFNKSSFGQDDLEYKKVYKGMVTTSNNKTKTVIVRAPSSGRLTPQSVMNQLAMAFEGQSGYTEYSLKVPDISSVRSFNVEITNEGEEAKTYGPFITNIVGKGTAYSIKNNIENALKTPKTSQRLYIFGCGKKGTDGSDSIEPIVWEAGNYSGTTVGIANKTFSLVIKKGKDKITTKSITISGGEAGEVTFESLSNQLSLALQQDKINVKFCYGSEGLIEEDDVTKKFNLPYLLFTNLETNEAISISIKSNDRKLLGDNLFVPVLNDTHTTVAASFDDYVVSTASTATNQGVPVGDLNGLFCYFCDVADTKATPLDSTVSVNVDINESTESIIFTSDGCKNISIKPTCFGNFLFEDEDITKSESEDADVKLLKENNNSAAGKFLASFEKEEGIDLSVELNKNRHVIIYEKDSSSPVELNVLEPREEQKNLENYLPLKDLIGEVLTESEFIAKGYAPNDPCVIKRTGKPAVLPEAQDITVFYAREVGEGTTNIGIDIYTSISPLNPSDVIHYIDLYVGGVKKESWEDVSYNPESDKYFVDLINEEPDNGGSAYIKCKVIKNDTTTSDVGLPNTDEVTKNGLIYLGRKLTDDSIEKTDDMPEDDYLSYDFAVGKNGEVDDSTDLFVEAMDTEVSGLCNKDLYSWHILITPDNITEDVQDAAIHLCETMEDGIYIADPPFGLTRKQVVDWHNGKLKDGRSSAFDTNYAATYWPWCKVYDSTSNKYIWAMPSIVMAAQYCRVDGAYGPWYAPAGETNGYMSSVIDIEEHPNKADRDAMYLDMNRVNPFLMLRNGSILAYGEKTLQRKNSTLTKIHTRRMLIALKKELANSVRGFIFMPTMSENISRVRSIISSIMERYRQGGGVASYIVVCDETNNTTETLQQDILNVAVTLVPTGCIEQVEICFTLDKTSSGS